MGKRRAEVLQPQARISACGSYAELTRGILDQLPPTEPASFSKSVVSNKRKRSCSPPSPSTTKKCSPQPASSTTKGAKKKSKRKNGKSNKTPVKVNESKVLKEERPKVSLRDLVTERGRDQDSEPRSATKRPHSTKKGAKRHSEFDFDDASVPATKTSSGSKRTTAGRNGCEESKQVAIYTFEMFCRLLASEPPSFTARKRKLLELCTSYDKTGSVGLVDYWLLWLEFRRTSGTVYWALYVKEDVYNSTTYDEPTVTDVAQSIAGGQIGPQKYHFLSFYEDDVDDDVLPLIHYRLDSTGYVAELQSMKKGTKFSGTEVLNNLLRLNHILDPRVLLCQDASIFAIPSPTNGKLHELCMRLFLPIVDLKGKSWYAKDGFVPVSTCTGRNFEHKEVAVQHSVMYFAAIQKVRQTTIGYLYRSYGKCNTSKNIKRLLQAFGDDPDSAVESEVTIHELARSLYLAYKNDPSGPAAADFLLLLDSILTPVPRRGKTPAQDLVLYNVALDTIHSHIMWSLTSTSSSPIGSAPRALYHCRVPTDQTPSASPTTGGSLSASPRPSTFSNLLSSAYDRLFSSPTKPVASKQPVSLPSSLDEFLDDDYPSFDDMIRSLQAYNKQKFTSWFDVAECLQQMGDPMRYLGHDNVPLR